MSRPYKSRPYKSRRYKSRPYKSRPGNAAFFAGKLKTPAGAATFPAGET